LRIIHVADTHIGYSAYRKVEENGFNQREMDVYRVFKEFVDQALEIRPDVILHSGDLFDSVRPTNRALSFALDQIIRISEAGIPLVVIAGNHCTPRLRETGSVFRLFDHLQNVYPIYRGDYQKIEIGDLVVHAVPHSDEETFKVQLEKMKASSDHRYNVAMMHAGIVGFSVFKMNEFNEHLVPSSYLREDFDYIALGHFHENCQVAKNADYAGSTERFSFSEAGHKKGFLVLDLEKGRKEFRRLRAREMLDLGPIDASDLDSSSLKSEMDRVLEKNDLVGKIVRLSVKNIPPSLYQTIDFHRLRSLAGEAVHFEPKLEIAQERVSVQGGGLIMTSLEQEFVSFLQKYPVERLNKDSLRSQGVEYIKRGMEESD
jgi:exonuclease SbcD